LEAAQKVISVNQQRKEKKLWTENQAGAPVTLVETSDEREEAQFVVSEVERLVSQREASLRDCAVMYRTNAQSRALEEFFLRYGVPYKLVGGVRFYQRREVKDLLAYLRLIHNPDDDLSLTRIINIPPRGIGQRTLEGLSRWAESLGVSLYRALQSLAAHPSGESSPFSSRPARALREFLSLLEECLARRGELRARELLDLVLERSGYRDYLLREADGEERWENVLELRAVAEEYQRFPPAESLASFLEKVTLISDVDSLDETTESVTLITLHQAKGLEFPVVFIVGMEEGVLPHFKSFEQPEQMEEERRLCYVGMTRAKKRLYLVRACHRGFLGGNPSLPSRFLQDIPPHLLLRRQGIESGALVSAGQLAPAPSPPSFRSGDHVRHARFGEGVVLSCSSTRDDQELVVDFGGRLGTKRLLLSLAPLERVA
jgi:DNA helicase-2/ATP-dependent DNA helicase PcrA